MEYVGSSDPNWLMKFERIRKGLCQLVYMVASSTRLILSMLDEQNAGENAVCTDTLAWKSLASSFKAYKVMNLINVVTHRPTMR